jgi:protein gp37
MGQQSKIAWCSDTWNYWIGCSKISPECAHCYADELDEKRFSKTLGGSTKENPVRHWGKGAPRHLTSETTRTAPRRWNESPLICNKCGQHDSLVTKPGSDCWQCHGGKFERRRVFTGSLMDWADEEVPDSWRDDVFDLAEKCPDILFLFLTKRAYNAYRYLHRRYVQHNVEIPRNFWVGMSWMKDRTADVRWMLRIPAAIRFLSVEPMLDEPCIFQAVQEDFKGEFKGVKPIHWIILGGESGDKARPCNVEWIRRTLRICRNYGIAPFVKQLGSHVIAEDVSLESWGYRPTLADVDQARRQARVILKDPKGGDMAEWPEDLRVQDFPQQP